MRKSCTCTDATCRSCVAHQIRAARELARLTEETKKRVARDIEVWGYALGVTHSFPTPPAILQWEADHAR